MTTTREAIAFLLAAAAGVGCGGSADGVVAATAVAEETSPPSGPSLGRGAARAPPREAQPSAGGDASGELATSSGRPRPAALDVALGDDACLVTTFTTDDAGYVYAAGTFAAPMTMGAFRVTSRGGDDVFLVKVTPDAKVAWALGVGSATDERAPKVTLRDRNVSLVGMTGGQLDCGDGPLPSWGSATFFMCLFGDADGTTRGGGVFPTGSP
jgi:hypothetical protein